MKRKSLAAAAVVALLAAGAGGAWYRRSSVIPVDVALAKKGTVEEIVTAVSAGTVKSLFESTVSTAAMGKVVEVRVREGDAVGKGDVLARLEDEETARQLDAASADVSQADEMLRQAEARREEAGRKHATDVARAANNLRKAKDDHRRAQELFRKGFLAKADMEQADTVLANAEEDARLAAAGEMTLQAIDREIRSLRARVEAAGAQRSALRERRRKLVVAAPFSGVVTKKTAEVGETKSPGAPLFVVADPKVIFVEAQIDESESSKIRVGQPVRLYPDAYLGQTFSGKVTEVRPTVEVSKEVSRANTIQIAPVSPPQPLRLGMSVDAEVLTGSRNDVLYAPSAAVMERDGKKFVFVVEKDRAARREVATGVSNWDRTEIVSGLAPGDAVITSLEIKNLAPGSRVAVRTRQ